MATIPYITGFNVRPISVSAIGIVTFTDGTNNITPNQSQCEAYGYTYNKATGTCTTFRYNTNLNRNISNANNTIRGSQNTTETGVNNTQIMGESNTVRSLSRNNLIVGSNNEIASGVNNTSVIGGTYGKVQRQSEVVIGGGGALGINQTSIVQLGGTTTDATDTFLTVQSDGSSFIAVQNNSIFGFEIKVIALCSGGSSGTAGDYAFIEVTGAIKVNDGFVLTIAESSTTIASVGSTGTVLVKRPASGYMTVQVTGAADRNIEWFASVQITEKKLSSGTF